MPYHKSNGCRKPATHLPYGVGIPVFHHIGQTMMCLTHEHLPQSRKPIGTTTRNLMPQLEHAAIVHTPAKRKPRSVRNRKNSKKKTRHTQVSTLHTYIRTRRNKKIVGACSMHPLSNEKKKLVSRRTRLSTTSAAPAICNTSTKRRSPTSPWLNPPSFSTAVLVSCL